uniref:Uncharacterized protein n=1 Tax=viral metagenome TaxID=1070528 RepID=A0A6C0CJ17_9ZZZZ
MNKSIKDLFCSKSNKQYSIISLSDITPKALNNINNGMGFLTLGILTTI